LAFFAKFQQFTQSVLIDSYPLLFRRHRNHKRGPSRLRSSVYSGLLLSCGIPGRIRDAGERKGRREHGERAHSVFYH